MSPSPNEAGFTLIELLVTLAIMALVSALLLPLLTSGMKKSGTERGHVIVQQVAESRHRAVRLQEQVALTLPEGAQWQASYPADSDAPVFYADGSAAGGKLKLASGESVNISWIDGHATLAR